jgi:hypothetical protein
MLLPLYRRVSSAAAMMALVLSATVLASASGAASSPSTPFRAVATGGSGTGSGPQPGPAWQEDVTLDGDRDGVEDGLDACPDSAGPDVTVDDNGCAVEDVDTDGDGVCDAGWWGPEAGLSPSRWCTGVDNCRDVVNPGQGDADGDGQGDACQTGACARVCVRAHFGACGCACVCTCLCACAFL